MNTLLPPAVLFEGVSIGFHGSSVHESISLSVSPGESVTFLGPSGTGKTVLLKLIVGLLRPLAGRIFIDGADITDLSEEDLRPVRQKVGFLFQGAALFDSLNVYENVAYGLREQGGFREEEIQQKVREKLELVGLFEKREAIPAELSGGQKKRVGLARALAQEPSIMLFDEPTTGLDPTSAKNINELIVHLNRSMGMTTLSVTHDIASAREISERWVLLAEGQILADGPAYELETSNEKVQSFIEGRWKGE